MVNVELKFNKTTTVFFILFLMVLSFVFGRLSVSETNASISTDRVEVIISNISQATYKQFSDSTTIGMMKDQYFYRGMVSRSMLEWQVENVCGKNYHADYENVSKRMWEAFEKCGCDT